ncbi:TIGR02444 family protein [Pseudomonas sp. GOM6]|uniref:TIGR02444 family protein n=1 Tax=Pseudomonas sp. GOM6 TaxID=3036944 RepID=UPI002409EC19|nr:TIGR02444 family protein [Pseudomonas sp. GOM6]MDG1579634.1 TIGR02444 family protein [Pseudomonas sp. GOM6]
MPSDLWSFACTCYARSGVEATCLRLQQQGQDVCLLLCALWLERRRIAYSSARLQQLQGISQAWQGDVVQPLRELRQRWRDRATVDPVLAQLREQLKTTELAAERELLERLEDLTQRWPAAETGRDSRWLDQLCQDGDAQQELRAAASDL